MSELHERKLSLVVEAVGASELAGAEDATTLAKMGYKQELRRNFSFIEVGGIAFSIIGLLPSIASTLSYSIPAGPVGLTWGWLVASIGTFVVALAMAELGSSLPTLGGLYFWTHYYSPTKWKNILSFLVGYSNTLGLVGVTCSVDYGFALMFLSVIVIARDGAWAATSGETFVVFLCTVCLHGVLASTLSKVMGRLQTTFSIMQLLLALATIIALPLGTKHRNDAAFIFTQTGNLTGWPAGWTWVMTWLSPMWTISCFDSCVHMSEEANNASRAVPTGILLSVGMAGVIGWILTIVIAACINPDLSSVLSTSFGQPMAQIYYDALGKHGAMGFMSFLMICQFCMGLSCVVASSRQMWAFARDGALPFSKILRKVSVRFGYIPLTSVWGCVLGAILLGLLTLIAEAAAEAVFSLTVAGLYLAYIIPIFARVAWGRDLFEPGPFSLGAASVPIAWAAVIWLLFALVLCMMPVGGPNPSPQAMNYTVVVAGAVWLGALTYFGLSARKWFKGPKVTLDADLVEVVTEERMIENDVVGKVHKG